MHKFPQAPLRLTVPALALLVLAGCAVTQPDYQRPASELPAAWNAAAAPSDAVSGGGAADGRWWRIYGDAGLERLIDEALAGNLDIVRAAARVLEAQALLDQSEAERRPTLSAGVNRSRSQSSRATATAFSGIPRETNDIRATLNAAYEIDLWGRLATATQAARADLLATEAARDTVRISLTAQIARGWFALGALDASIDSVRATLALRERALGLQRQRAAAGVISEYDLRQLEAELEAARAQLPPLERDRELQETALAVLAGRSPKGVYEARFTKATADPARATPVAVPGGLPSELLLRRPDIVQAEQSLIALNARVAIVRTSYFPSLSLTGFLGSQSASLGNLFTGPAGIWQFAIAASQPIFAGGRLEAQVKAAQAREQQALAQYQQAIQTAFREVRDALTAQARARESFDAETRRAAALADTLRLARLRYDNGLASQLEVLDAERAQLAAELNRVEALRAQRAAVADLYKALGGGW